MEAGRGLLPGEDPGAPQDEDPLEPEWEELRKLVAPDPSPAADEKYRGIFHGYPLTVEHNPAKNPFKRDESFRGRTNHYNPDAVGDNLNKKTHDALVRGGYIAGSYELRSLVPKDSQAACAPVYQAA